MSVSGHWDGKLLDVSGVDALIALDLRESGQEVKGKFTATLLPAAEDVCGGATRGPSMSGPIAGTVDARGNLVLKSELESQGQRIVAVFSARPGKPDPHARLAFFGGYDVQEGASALTLQGGACVLWQFAGARREGAVS
jgi:hypothetical protein